MEISGEDFRLIDEYNPHTHIMYIHDTLPGVMREGNTRKYISSLLLLSSLSSLFGFGRYRNVRFLLDGLEKKEKEEGEEDQSVLSKEQSERVRDRHERKIRPPTEKGETERNDTGCDRHH